MKCTKCGADIADNVRICPNCECAVQRPKAAAAKPMMMYGILALALIAIIALVIALFAQRGKNPVIAVSPDTHQRPITTAPAPAMPSQPITAAPTPMPPQPGQPAPKQNVPPEVLDYLNYVKWIEGQRQALLRDQAKALSLAAAGQADSLGALFDMAMDPGEGQPADPFKPVREELSRQVTNWQNLLRQFDQKPVPQQCGQFAGAYRMAIATETAAINKVTTIMAGVSESSKQSITDALGELQAMKKDPQTQGGIDRAVETADANLGALCKHYGIEKPFNVPKEQAGGSLVGL